MPARIPFDSLTLRAVADELRRTVVGGVVQQIAQPSPVELTLTIRHRAANRTLLLSCDASFARVHLTDIKRPKPPVPPPFCMLCRKYLEGATLAAVEQRGVDRILDLHFGSPSGEAVTLVAELMGKHSNLIAVGAGGMVLDAAKRIPHRLSRHREVLPGRRYVPPPPQPDRADPFTATQDEVRAFVSAWPADPEARTASLMAHFGGLSPFLAEELVRRAEQASLEEAWDEVFGAARRGEWAPVLVRGEDREPVGAYPFPTVQHPAGLQNPRDSISTALDHYYGIALPRSARDTVRHELQTALDRALKARDRQRQSLERSLQEAGRADEYRQAGELLLANLHAIPPEAASATVLDYYAPDTPERAIALDPKLSARENADAYFRRYRKAKEGVEALTAQLTRTQADIAGLQSARLRVDEAPDEQALQTLRTDLLGSGLLRPESGGAGPAAKAPADFEGHRIRTLHTPDGWELLLGENEDANSYLVTRVAAPDDIWVHVRANVSAHVVIRTGRNPAAVPHGVIRQAALLAARHSPAKHSSTVPVDYTLRKYVRRPRGAAPGAVLYRNEKTVYVDPAEPR